MISRSCIIGRKQCHLHCFWSFNQAPIWLQRRNNCMFAWFSTWQVWDVLFVVKKVHIFRIRIKKILWPSFCPLSVGEAFERVSITVILGPCHAPAFPMQLTKKEKPPCISMVTTGIKNASKLPSATGRSNDRRRRVLLMPDRNIPYYVNVRNILSLTYIMHQCTNNHIHVSSPPPHPLLKTIELHSVWIVLLLTMAACQPLSIFLRSLVSEYIPNALWIDAVLWALAITLHLKCGCLWNGLEWNGGKKEPVSYFRLLPAVALTSVSFASLTLSLEINDKMSSIWNGVFPLPSMTVQDSVNNNDWNG